MWRSIAVTTDMTPQATIHMTAQTTTGVPAQATIDTGPAAAQAERQDGAFVHVVARLH
jgi:hypothetical protein